MAAPTPSPEFDDGPDFTWVLTHGADLAWHYAFAVQTLLVDLDAAAEIGDWPLCIDIGHAALQAMVVCELRGRGVSRATDYAELQLRLAADDCAAARAMRALPPAASASREQAGRAIELVWELDAALRGRIPVEVPVLRSETGARQSMRLSAAIVKWRTERGLGMPDWRPRAATGADTWL